MKKIIYTLSIVLGLGLNANAQIDKLAGPRLGAVYISASPASGFLNGTSELFDDLEPDFDPKGAVTSLYGWQFESRFADGYQVTGIVEWIILVGGMERGKFLPSASSMVGARMENGFEFAIGPNLSLGGIAMVFGIGYNFKVGDLNLPVNLAFVPGRAGNIEGHTEGKEVDPDGIPYSGDEYWQDGDSYNVEYHTGNRLSITFGFNLGS